MIEKEVGIKRIFIFDNNKTAKQYNHVLKFATAFECNYTNVWASRRRPTEGAVSILTAFF